MNPRALTIKTVNPHLIAIFMGCLLATGLNTAFSAKPGDIQYERRSSEEADSAAELSSFPPAVFPHWVHRIHYRCDACHDSLFEMKRGGTLVTMDLMKEGKVCGACHNSQTAFGSDFQTCSRCHAASQE